MDAVQILSQMREGQVLSVFGLGWCVGNGCRV